MSKKYTSNEDLKTDLEEMCQCNICFEQYNDPRTLNCTHSFCMSCIEKWSGFRATTKNCRVVCPTCREVTALPEGKGICDLRKDFKISRLTQLVQESPAEIKERCVNCEQATASCICKQCHDYFCQAEDDGYCEFHGRQQQYYCEDCQSAICNKCFMKEHQEHVVMTFEEKVKPLTKDLVDNLVPLREKLNKLIESEKCVLSTEEAVATLERHKRRIINSPCDVIIDYLQRLKNANNAQLETVMRSVAKECEILRSDREFTLSKGESLLEYIEKLLKEKNVAAMMRSGNVLLEQLTVLPAEIDETASTTEQGTRSTLTEASKVLNATQCPDDDNGIYAALEQLRSLGLLAVPSNDCSVQTIAVEVQYLEPEIVELSSASPGINNQNEAVDDEDHVMDEDMFLLQLEAQREIKDMDEYNVLLSTIKKELPMRKENRPLLLTLVRELPTGTLPKLKRFVEFIVYEGVSGEMDSHKTFVEFVKAVPRLRVLTHSGNQELQRAFDMLDEHGFDQAQGVALTCFTTALYNMNWLNEQQVGQLLLKVTVSPNCKLIDQARASCILAYLNEVTPVSMRGTNMDVVVRHLKHAHHAHARDGDDSEDLRELLRILSAAISQYERYVSGRPGPPPRPLSSPAAMTSSMSLSTPTLSLVPGSEATAPSTATASTSSSRYCSAHGYFCRASGFGASCRIRK